MKRITTLIAVIFAALVCVTSCGSSSSSGDEPEPSNVVLAAKSFVGTEWTGSDANGKITLKVNTATEMTLNYYTQKTLSKKNDPEPELITVSISYTYDETQATFSGKGKEDNNSYSGKINTAKSMSFKMPSQEVTLTR